MSCTKTLGRRGGHSVRAAIVAVLALSVFATPATVHAEEQGRPLFSGQATGLRAQVLTLPAIVISDTGPIPESGDDLRFLLVRFFEWLQFDIPGPNHFHG